MSSFLPFGGRSSGNLSYLKLFHCHPGTLEVAIAILGSWIVYVRPRVLGPYCLRKSGSVNTIYFVHTNKWRNWFFYLFFLSWGLAGCDLFFFFFFRTRIDVCLSAVIAKRMASYGIKPMLQICDDWVVSKELPMTRFIRSCRTITNFDCKRRGNAFHSFLLVL